jgi:diguanylate cyclase (GGDEF)-like protein/PAS domain S-box-containing protein
MKKDFTPEFGKNVSRAIKWPTFLQLEESHTTANEQDDRAFRTLIENLPAMCYLTEPTPPFTPIYTSPSFETFGYSLDEWRSSPDVWLTAIHPDDRERVIADVTSARSAGKDVDHEYRLIARDGTEFWVRDRGRFLPDADGKPACWLGVMMDVTDRKKAEQYLSESEARYRKVFEDANDIIYIHDLDGNYRSVNGAVEKILGYPLDEVLSMNMSQVVAPDQFDIVRNKLQTKLSGERSKTQYQVDCITSEGQRKTLEVNSSVVFKDGIPFGVQGIARDVTERKRAESALRKSEEQYRELFENSSDLIYAHDLRGYFTSINSTTQRTIGYSRQEALKLNVNKLIAPEMLSFAREMTMRTLAGEQPAPYELDLISKEGRRVPVELTTRAILKDGIPIGIQGNARDITERKRAEDSLRETVSVLTSTLESSNDGILVVTPENQIVIYNHRFLEMWDIPQHVIEQKSGQAVLDHVKDLMKEPNAFEESTLRLHSVPFGVLTDTLEFKDGRIYERYSQPQYLDGNAVGRVVSFRDITERRRSEEQLRHNALYDTLTGLPNRAHFMNYLRTAIERFKRNPRSRFAVLFLDLDRFKVVNDSLGHMVGDDLLIGIAKRLRTCLRPGDLVARFGGDEFTILLNRSGDREDVVNVAERLQSKLAEPYKIGNYEVLTSASVGIILSDTQKRRPEDYLRDADTAMYRAKDSGKARYVVFDHEMHVRNVNRLQIESDLRQAIERSEFEVFYQPIVRMESGSIQEFEALIRWRHPIHGLVAPSEFIGVAEETGLIITIGRLAMERACRQVAEWQRQVPLPLSVSVNLSAKQLMDTSLTDQVQDVLQRTGLATNQLKLEVTETSVMENTEGALAVLSKLESLGVALSTDDFGTGYSSLSYLHRFPFSRLKIDKSFVNQMSECNKSRAIVKTILMLGKNLRVEVVAEGIETDGQFKSLRDLGCRLGQGYLFSKPIDAETTGQLLIEKASSIKSHLAIFKSGRTKESRALDVL